MVLAYLLMIFSFIWLVFASIVDIKKREVPDWISFSLIGIGLGIRLIYSVIFNDYKILLFGLMGLISCFLFGSLMYYTRQWGGGDAKLLSGLGAMFGDYKTNLLGYDIPFLITLIVNIFIAGAFYSILFSIYLALKNKQKFLNEWMKKKHYEYFIIILIFFISITFTIIKFDGLYLIFILIFLLLITLLASSVFFIRVVERSCLINKINVNNLVEGDWLLNHVKIKNRVICKARMIGLTNEDIINLKKNKIKFVIIREGIPFVPAFLIGFIISVLI